MQWNHIDYRFINHLFLDFQIFPMNSNPTDWDNHPSLIDLYSQLRPFVFSSILSSGKGFDTEYGLCTPLQGTPIISIYWTSLDQSLILYLRYSTISLQWVYYSDMRLHYTPNTNT